MQDKITTHAPIGKPETAPFQVDSALLRELGERLVGQAHIALAELIKNAYDADATLCTVQFGADEITVSDNGHGMTEEEFLKFWMRIGTTNKQSTLQSRDLLRPITGSKGVGRLSAQFLARDLQLVTSSSRNSQIALTASVDWDRAVDAGELTKATAEYTNLQREDPYAGQSRNGTRVIMNGLKQSWGPKQYEALAAELWMLQPPIPEKYGRIATNDPDPSAFKVQVLDSSGKQITSFDEQMGAAIENWIATIDGRIWSSDGASNATVEVRFADGSIHPESFETQGLVTDASWQIRIFNLAGRQSKNVPVKVARDYFSRFGGVGVYDAGFRLPYYGVKQDWLNIEYDHSHRRNKSALLPSELHVPRALNDLPSQGRIFGYATVNTAQEANRASPEQKKSGNFLKIQVTRDRLVTNEAYEELRDAVRWSLDYYATRQRLKQSDALTKKRPSEPSAEKLSRLHEAIHAVQHELSDESFNELEREISDYTKALDGESAAREAEQILLGPLATAGITALALEHENKKEYSRASALVKRLKHVSIKPEEVAEIAQELSVWLVRLSDLRDIFSPLLSRTDREEIASLNAASVAREAADSLKTLLPTTSITVVGDDRVMLPLAAYAEWQSVFQNVFMNSANAMLDKRKSEILVEIKKNESGATITISDLGFGVDLETSSELFEPFKRRSEISEERKQLGLGGTGLGLTIVRMIAENRNCKVRFVDPRPEYTTTFEMTWN